MADEKKMENAELNQEALNGIAGGQGWANFDAIERQILGKINAGWDREKILSWFRTQMGGWNKYEQQEVLGFVYGILDENGVF